MNLPGGTLLRQRVVSDPATILESVLANDVTGYARLESQDALLLDGDGVGIITFENGIPVVAYHTGTDRGGAAGLADIAVSGPYRLELYETDLAVVEQINESRALRIPPELPADQLAGDPALADRTVEKAKDRKPQTPPVGQDSVEAFLQDEETINRIRQHARETAQKRAEEWDL